MTRHFIKDSNGKDVKTSNGERLFWSDLDGDRKDDQTVYREHRGIFGGSSKVDVRYDPEKGRFKK